MNKIASDKELIYILTSGILSVNNNLGIICGRLKFAHSLINNCFKAV